MTGRKFIFTRSRPDLKSHKGSWLYQQPAAKRTTRSFHLSRKKYGELRQNPYAH
jgi:hypothetical protein